MQTGLAGPDPAARARMAAVLAEFEPIARNREEADRWTEFDGCPRGVTRVRACHGGLSWHYLNWGLHRSEDWLARVESRFRFPPAADLAWRAARQRADMAEHADLQAIFRRVLPADITRLIALALRCLRNA